MSLAATHDDQPFDKLPIEIVQEIFQRALSPLPPGIGYVKKPSTRLSLSHVCRLWKKVLQSRVCIGVPEKYHLLFTKHAARYGRLASRINSLAQFAGPLRLTIERGIVMNPEGDCSEELRFLAVALAATHRATLILRLDLFSLKDLEHLMMDTKRLVFSRITSLSLSDPLVSHPTLTPHPTTAILHPSMPKFPMLTHISLYEGVWGVRTSIRDIQWSWLFQSSVCDNLLSFSSNNITAADISWLLSQTTRLLDLSVSRKGDSDNERDLRLVIAHQNLKKLSLGFGYSSPSVSCPNLTSLTSYPATPDDDLATLPALDPNINLTTFNLHEVENLTTGLHLLRPNLSTLTSLYIAKIAVETLSEVVGAVCGDHLPNLSYLFLYLSLSRFNSPLDHTSSLLSFITTSLRQLSQPRRAKPQLLTIGFRISKYSLTRPTLFRLASLLCGAPDQILEDLRPDADKFFDPYAALMSFGDVLGTNPQVPLSKIAEEWTAFVKGIERWTTPYFPGYELLVSAPLFWTFFGRVKNMVEGTSFDSHADIVGRWKMEVGERERRSWTGKKKFEKWRVSAVPGALFMKINGLYSERA